MKTQLQEFQTTCDFFIMFKSFSIMGYKHPTYSRDGVSSKISRLLTLHLHFKGWSTAKCKLGIGPYLERGDV